MRRSVYSIARGVGTGMLFAAMCILIATSLASNPAEAAITQRSGTPTLHVWNPGFQNYGAVGSDMPTTALQDAHNFDIIVDQPGAFKSYPNGKKYDKATIAAMKQANPNLKFLYYLSGCCDGVAKDTSNYPESAYAHTASGARINSPSGNPLMNRRDSTWVSTRASHCKAWVDAYGGDGCLYDSSSFSWFNQNSPIDPKTNKPWTQADYNAAGEAMFAGVKQALGPNGYVAINGLGSGSRYVTDSGIVGPSVDMGMAENWMQSPKNPVTSYDTGSTWVDDMKVAVDLASKGKWFIPTIKSWTTGTQAQKDTLNKYAAATLLLGGDTHSYLAFEDEHGDYGGSQYYSFWNQDIGTPVGAYFTSGNCYVRKFTKGYAVVNPNSATCTYSLGSSFTNMDGNNVTTASLAPQTGDVYAGSCGSSCGPSDSPPSLNLASPQAGATVAPNSAVTITGTSSDDKGVASVEVRVDGTSIKSFTGSATSSFSAAWTAPATSGTHTITAIATDTAGQTTTKSVSVSVGAATCTTTHAPGAYGTITTQASVTAGTYKVWSRMMAGDAANNSYDLVIGDACTFNKTISTTTTSSWIWVAAPTNVTLPDGSVTVNMYGTKNNVNLDRVLLVADPSCVPVDMGDNCMTGGGDTQAPTVSVSASPTSVTAGGTVSLTATATDNVGVAKVEYYVDGVLLGTDRTAPYAYNWDTTGVTTGNHDITAKAYDAAGNVAVSSPASVMVNGSGQTTGNGDANGDGKANMLDVSIWLNNDMRADFNHNGALDAGDLAVIQGNWQW